MGRLPKKYVQFMSDYPEVGKAYEEYGVAIAHSGPLDERLRSLIKLGISIGARLEGGAKSHAHKALQAGAKPDELRHVALLSAPTIGFPAMMAGLSTINDVIKDFNDENHR